MSITSVKLAFDAALPEGYQCTAARMDYLPDVRGYALEFDVVPPDGIAGHSRGEFPADMPPEAAATVLAKQIGAG